MKKPLLISLAVALLSLGSAPAFAQDMGVHPGQPDAGMPRGKKPARQPPNPGLIDPPPDTAPNGKVNPGPSPSRGGVPSQNDRAKDQRRPGAPVPQQ